jgi:transforming growth factor-beta-induced protein
MNRLMLSAVMVGLALAGCDYGDPRLPLPPGDVGQEGAPTGGGNGTTETGSPDAGGADDGGLPGDGGAPDGGVMDGGVVDGGVMDGGVTGTIAEVAASNPDLALFMMAVDKAGLMGELRDASGTLTVFAPTNAAFAAMLTELGLSRGFDALSAEQLQPILRYHVLPARVTANDAVAASGTSVEALGGRIAISVDRQMLRLDGVASVTTADVQASNGIIHVIDRVLLPSAHDVITTTVRLSSLAAALGSADRAAPSPGLAERLDDDSQTLTVFAPDDRGFDKLVAALTSSGTGIMSLESFRPDQLSPIVRYHVLDSELLSAALLPVDELESLGGTLRVVSRPPATLTVDGATVLTADLYCSNGVVHVVDSVLLPSITDVISTDERFRALFAVITAADAEPTLTRRVGEALDSPNEFTFFAPSNQAFTALGTPPAGPALANVLFFHAVPGEPLYSARAVTLTTPVPLMTSIDQPLVLQSSGTPPRVTLTDGRGSTASVTQVDLFTSNGVIHVIDRVLIPAL